MEPIAAAALMIGVYELAMQGPEWAERHGAWAEARAYCRAVGKPLLRIGIKRSPLEPPNGDVTLDIDPVVLSVPGGVLGDERAMSMFRNAAFGACVNEHTLEHLHTPADVAAAVAECLRVADWAYFLFPSEHSVVARLHPDHHLQLQAVEDGIRVHAINSDGPWMDVPVPNASIGASGSLVRGSAWTWV